MGCESWINSGMEWILERDVPEASSLIVQWSEPWSFAYFFIYLVSKTKFADHIDRIGARRKHNH